MPSFFMTRTDYTKRLTFVTSYFTHVHVYRTPTADISVFGHLIWPLIRVTPRGGRQFFPLLSPFSFPLLTLTFLGNLMPNLATKGVREEEGRIAAMGRRQAAAAKNHQRSV